MRNVTTIANWFISPRLPANEEAQRRARYLISTILLTSAMLLLFSIYYLFIDINYVDGVASSVTLLMSLGILLFFRFTGLSVLSANLFLLVNSIHIFIQANYNGGIFSPDLTWFCITPALAFLFGGRSIGLWWTLIIGLLLTYFFMEEFLGFASFRQDTVTLDAAYYYVAFLPFTLFFTIVLFIYERGKEKATRALQQANEAIIAQNEELQQQQEEIAAQHDLIDEKNKHMEHVLAEVREINHELTSSIQYAHAIQKAILGTEQEIIERLENGFLFFSPKAIVAGDFYGCIHIDDCKIVIAADCTGHGIAASFMTVVGSSFSKNIIETQRLTQPDHILYELDRQMHASLHRESEYIDYDIEISVVVFNKSTRMVSFAGAKNAMVHVRNKELRHIGGSRIAIGATLREMERVFEPHTFEYMDGDAFYLFSDGFEDQQGGPEGKKYMRKQFHQMLINISGHPPQQQKQMVKNELERWRGNRIQTDDILLIGLQY